METLSHHPQHLADKQLAAIFALGLTSLLRRDEWSPLKVGDIRFFPFHMHSLLRQHKNGPFREGQ